MKKLVCLLCAACLVFASCGEVTPPPPPQVEHVHSVQTRTIEATCTEGGKVLSYCGECGENLEERDTQPLGHLYPETSESPSRLRKCQRAGCFSGVMPESDRIYDEQITYTFDAGKRAEIDGYYRTMEETLEREFSDDASITLLNAFSRFYNSISYLSEQYRYADLLYYKDFGSEKTRNDFEEISAYYTENTSKLYVIFYEICQSEFSADFTDILMQSGWSQPLIDVYVHYGELYREQDYAALQNRNTQILLEYRQMENVEESSAIPELYREYVSNYNQIAKVLGYENYPDYAYRNIYYRDYTYRDVGVAAGYIKQYLSPLYAAVCKEYEEYIRSEAWTQAEINEYMSLLSASFFDNTISNNAVNDYFESVTDKNAEKEISFAAELQSVMKNGNYFLTDGERAFTSYVSPLEVTFMTFGPDYYRTAFTVVHEFGHYFDYIYNGNLATSYDLKETQSQGNEAIFLAFLKDAGLSERAYRGVFLYRLQSALGAVISTMAVDTFETAVFTNEYSGGGAFLSDGKITPDEYDALYNQILSDLGVEADSAYWRKTVFGNPCYYVSYSLSQVSCLQLLVEAEKNSVESALQKYLKLFTYPDSHHTIGGIFGYAGLYNYWDEALYRELSGYIQSVIA